MNEQAQPQLGNPVSLALIDCDVHPLMPLDKIIARMSVAARKGANFLEASATASREHNRNLHPSGPLRLDAIPPGGGQPGSDPAFMVNHYMDPFGVSAALLCPIQATAVIPWGDEDAVSQFLAAVNDYLLEEWFGLDRRYRVLASVSPHNADAAVKEIERVAGRRGIVGINIPMAEINMGSANLRRLYECAAYHRLPVCVHPNSAEGNLMTSPTHAGGISRSYAEHHLMIAQAAQGAAAALALSGTLARLPDLTIVFVEYGFAWFPGLLWKMDAAWSRAGGPDEKLHEPPSTYALRQFRFTTQPFVEAARPRDVWPLLEAMQADRTLMFSSDYPHWDTDNPQVVLTNRLPPALRNRVAAGNAIDCFGERLWN
jgi:predicted TIM-barrel fold metal-dependent hydrolase